jgi:hypothetical protein
MRLYIKLAIVSLVVLSTAITSQAQAPKFVNEFLNIGVGARAHGMFGSVVADVDDVTAAFWNPAGLSNIEAPFEVSAMHAEWFGSVANYDYIGIGKRLDPANKSFGALTVIRLGVDNIPNTLSLIGPDGSVDFDRVTTFSAADYAFLLSYGRALKKTGMSIGGSAKIIRRSVGDFGGAWGFGFDLGWMYKKKNFSLGVMAKDITTTFNTWTFNLSDEEKAVFAQTGNDIPVSSTEINLPKLLVAGAYKITKPKVSYLVQAQLNISSNGTQAGVFSGDKINLDPTLGLEVGIIDRVFIRAGIGNIQNVINEVNSVNASLEVQPNIGLGVKVGRLNIDYALTNIAEVAGSLSSHIVSLRLRFNEREPISNLIEKQ